MIEKNNHEEDEVKPAVPPAPKPEEIPYEQNLRNWKNNNSHPQNILRDYDDDYAYQDYRVLGGEG